MDLVLDELTNNDQNVIKENDVNVIYDSKLKNYLETNSVVVDYKKNMTKTGFFVMDSGSSCC